MQLIPLNVDNTKKIISNVDALNNISIPDKVVDQVLLQSGGVGLGVLISIFGTIILLKWLGAGTIIKNILDKLERAIDSATSLASSVEKLADESKEARNKTEIRHNQIMDEFQEVKNIIKTTFQNFHKKRF
ncbi:hypothetical protein AMR41_29430 [Hapalosiphon sp. MRB220]|nr:hypothetical protein AMR41_29430 [Hapalosiphon sp. MRB220]